MDRSNGAGTGQRRRLLWLAAGLSMCLAPAAAVAASGAGNYVGGAPGGVPRGGGPTYDRSLVRIISPANGALIIGGRPTVRVRTTAPVGSLQVLLNGRSVRGQLSAVGGGGYEATLDLGGPLHYGNNLLIVSTGSGGRFGFSASNFVLARRVPGLAAVQSVRLNQPSAPVVVTARIRPNAILRASVNGRSATSAFTSTDGRLVGLLSPNDGVMPGPNRLVITAYTSSPRNALATTIASRFSIPGSRLLASAGSDQTVLQGQFVKLTGNQSLFARGDRRRSFAWRIIRAPAGSRARLIHRNAKVPVLVPDVPGAYRIGLTIRGARSRGATAGSADTITVTAEPNSPYGVPLQSNGSGGAILLNGQAVANTTRGGAPGISYAILDRETLAVVASGTQQIGQAGLDQLLARAKSYSDGTKLLVLNWKGALEPFRSTWAAIFKQMGGDELPADDKFSQPNLPGSEIGILGATGGSAFIDHRDLANRPDPGNLSGYLRLNPVDSRFNFVFVDDVPVDTSSSQLPSSSSITVGAEVYKVQHTGIRNSGGFQLLVLDPRTLAPISNTNFNTNISAIPQGGITALANALTSAAADPARPLVILQSWGTPSSYGSPQAQLPLDWDRAALAIQKLGGTRQVFDDLNQPPLEGQRDDEQGRKGGYAFIGRTGAMAPRAEVSYPLDGLPARLEGLLTRTRTAGYEAMMVGPPARLRGLPPVNAELVRIANQAPTPFPPLAPGAPADQVRAAENFLGGPSVMKVCPAGVTCNVRETYYTNSQGNWPSIQSALVEAGRTGCPDPPKDLTPAVCERVRAQLVKEVDYVSRVQRYLGPLGLQQPFGAAEVSALANLGRISEQIQQAVNPPPEDNTTSDALQITAYLAKIPSVAGPEASAVAGGVSAAFELSAFLTRRDGSPNLIGPAIRTTAFGLGVELAKRYATAGDQLNALQRIIVSDYGKLTAVGGKVDSDPYWILGDPGKARDELERVAKQTITERLVPLAYPVLYDLGLPFKYDARLWTCFFKPSVFVPTRYKYLFKDEPDGGEVPERFPNANWNPIMAAGAVHATGHESGARIPSPPASVIDPMFAPTALGGLGMKKLEFYTPKFFRLFPANPRKGSSAMVWPDPNASSPECDNIPDPPGDSG